MNEGVLVGCIADECGLCAIHGCIYQVLCSTHSIIEPKETTRLKYHSNITPPL